MASDDPVTAWARVAADNRDECQFARLAADRHLRDLGQQRTDAFPFYFDAAAAAASIAFFRLAKHIKWEWANTPIVLQPWQSF